MTIEQWQLLCQFKNKAKTQFAFWEKKVGFELESLQKILINNTYNLETSIVYNSAWENIKNTDNIKLILVADNPGKQEQLAINRCYLCGSAGKIAQGFFTKNISEIDFKHEVIILNKTPIHTATTQNLKKLKSLASPTLQETLVTSQIFMAKNAVSLALIFNCPIWLIGYSELVYNGIFSPFAKSIYAESKIKNIWQNIYVFQHFSRNCFTTDIKKHPSHNLQTLGIIHKEKIFSYLIRTEI